MTEENSKKFKLPCLSNEVNVDKTKKYFYKPPPRKNFSNTLDKNSDKNDNSESNFLDTSSEGEGELSHDKSESEQEESGRNKSRVSSIEVSTKHWKGMDWQKIKEGRRESSDEGNRGGNEEGKEEGSEDGNRGGIDERNRQLGKINSRESSREGYREGSDEGNREGSEEGNREGSEKGNREGSEDTGITSERGEFLELQKSMDEEPRGPVVITPPDKVRV